MAFRAPEAVSPRNLLAAQALACDLTASDGLLEALEVEVVATVGFDDRPVLLADVAFVVFVLGLLPNWGDFLVGHGLPLLEALEVVDDEVEDDEKEEERAGCEDWVMRDVPLMRYWSIFWDCACRYKLFCWHYC